MENEKEFCRTKRVHVGGTDGQIDKSIKLKWTSEEWDPLKRTAVQWIQATNKKEKKKIMWTTWFYDTVWSFFSEKQNCDIQKEIADTWYEIKNSKPPE